MSSLLSVRATHAMSEAAFELGLWRELLKGSATIDELADRLGLAAGPLRIALGVLANAKLLTVSGDNVDLTPTTRRELLGPAGLDEADRSLWRSLPGFVRTGHTVHRPEGAHRGPRYAEIVARLGAMMDPSAVLLAKRLAPMMRPRARVLDVGAGSLVWSKELLRELPDAQATALDLPEVVDTAQKSPPDEDLAPRIRYLPGDVFEMDLPVGAYDVIILANVLHLEPEPRAQSLFLRVAPSLAAGGFLVVVDAMSDDASNLDEASYRLQLAMRQPGASPLPETLLRAWLEQVGAPTREKIDLGFFTLCALVGARRD